jgi:hypothetical protein
MCQSTATTYAFCGCRGTTYQQNCPEPSSTCELLLARPSRTKLQCYCEKHSSQRFKSRREYGHENKRVNKEYQEILQRERLREESARHRIEGELREKGIEALKYDEFLAKGRRKAEEYRRGKAEKKAGTRPGIREKSDGICRIM